MKYKILVVDDDKELVKMLCSYFNMKHMKHYGCRWNGSIK